MGIKCPELLMVVSKNKLKVIKYTKSFKQHQRRFYQALQGRGPSYIHFIT